MTLTPEQTREILAEIEAWASVVSAKEGGGFVHITIKLDLKDRRVIGIRGGAEMAQSRKVS